MADMGELVDTTTETTTIDGREWELEARVYYTGNHYNVKCYIKEMNVGFFETAERYSKLSEREDSKDKIPENIGRQFAGLVEYADGFADARELDVNVTVE